MKSYGNYAQMLTRQKNADRALFAQELPEAIDKQNT